MPLLCTSILLPLSPEGEHDSRQSHKVHKSVLQSCVSKTELLARHRGQKRRLHSSLTLMHPGQSGGFSGYFFYKTMRQHLLSGGPSNSAPFSQSQGGRRRLGEGWHSCVYSWQNSTP